MSHDDVDAMVMHGRPPYVELVNGIVGILHGRPVAPPEDGWDEPMHWDPARRIANGMPPMPFKADGGRHDMRAANRMGFGRFFG